MRELAQKIQRIESGRRPRDGILSTGISSLDGLLPDRGFRAGTIVEWLGRRGSGVNQLAFLAARPALSDGALMVVLDQEASFYPPAAAGLALDLSQLIIVRPQTAADTLWAMEQVLRCSGVAVSLCRLDRIRSTVFRRLQLAVERSGGLGFLIRPPCAGKEPAWSDVRLEVQSLGPLPSGPRPHPHASEFCPASGFASGRRWLVKLLRCRRGIGDEASIVLNFHESTGVVCPDSRNESPRRARRAAGA